MSEFTKGKWEAERVNSPYIIWRVTDSSRYNSVATGIYKEADARLIAAAPEMYDELYEALQLIKGKSCYEGDEFDVQAKSIRELFNRIDGKTSKGEESECRDLKI